MIVALLLSSGFLILLFMGVIAAAVYIKKRTEELEAMNQARYDDLKKRIDDTHNLVINQAQAVLDSVNNLLNPKNNNHGI